jgi:hypothetical protein
MINESAVQKIKRTPTDLLSEIKIFNGFIAFLISTFIAILFSFPCKQASCLFKASWSA